LARIEDDLSDQAHSKVESAHETWQQRWAASMSGRLEELRSQVRRFPAERVSAACGAELVPHGLRFLYWGSPIRMSWPGLEPFDDRKGQACSLFDTLLLLYYLKCSDGTPLSDQWIGFREFPGGAFYHQAFQGYSGDRLAKEFASSAAAFKDSALSLGGFQLTALSEFAYAFSPLPRLRLAAILWPGDEEFPGRGAILFDASGLHYMVLDGLAVLGARLVDKLVKARNVQANSTSSLGRSENP
jgi:hypothetical protein